MKERAKRGSFNLNLVTGVIILIVIIGLIIAYISISKEKNKPSASNLQEQAQSSEQLNSIAPAGEKQGNTETGKESAENPSVSNAVGTSEGGGGSSSSESPSGSTQSISSQGILRIANIVDAYTSNAFKIIHWPGASEGRDSFDRHFEAIYDPGGVTTKIVSKIDSTDIDSEFRPLNSMSDVHLQLSIVSQSGNSVAVDSANWLHLEIIRPNEGNFEGKTITIQQYNPNSTSASYPVYNVRDVIANQKGIISLPNLKATYSSEVPYAYFKVSFSA